MNKLIFPLIVIVALFSACSTSQKTQTPANGKTGMNKTHKGAIIGASSGGVIGAVIGNKKNNTAVGAILGAAAGGALGAVIGNRMDKQAKKMEEDLGGTATVERVGEGIKLTFDSQLLFDTGKSNLKSDNKDDLQKLAETLKQYPDTELLIVGHTDNVGSDAFNQKLSKKRAAAVSSQLKAFGVSSNRLSTEGKGETQPAVSNDSESSRTQNRRVEIAIFASDKMKTDAQKEVQK